MPFSKYANLAPKTLTVMAQAYDAALVRLGIKNPDPRTSKLALEIRLASEKGRTRSSEVVRRGFGKSTKFGRQNSRSIFELPQNARA